MLYVRSALCAALVTLAAGAARSGGIAWYEIGTPDVGTASAGRAALAMDASTAWGNPAGMAFLEGTQVMLALQPSWFSTKFEPQAAGTTVSGTNGGEAGGGFDQVASGFLTWTRPSGFSLGVALVPNLSQTLEYDQTFVGRYFVQRSSLSTFALNPVVAFKTDSWVSFGLGANIVFGALDKTSAVNNLLDAGAPDGQI
ncbi:MAG: OmpP1/FadL family transporter, partial [bacterium]